MKIYPTAPGACFACAILLASCSDGSGPAAAEHGEREMLASAAPSEAVPTSTRAEPSTDPNTNSGGGALDSSAPPASGPDVAPAGDTSRGELTGTTYCEKLRSCCAQMNAGTLSSERASCEEDLAEALQDPSSAERDCWYALDNNVDRLYCGPVLKGKVTVKFEGAHSSEFTCDSSAQGPTLSLNHDSSTALISCPATSAEIRYSNSSITLPTTVGMHESDGLLPPQGSFVYTDATGMAHGYSIADVAVFSANVVSFEPSNRHLVATMTMDFASGSSAGSPAAALQIAVDTELPEPLGPQPERE